MSTNDRFADRLREWSGRPTAVSAEEAAARVATELHPRTPLPRAGPLRPLLAAAAALAVVVAALVLLRNPSPPPAAGATTATIVLSSGTQVVIDLGEVQP